MSATCAFLFDRLQNLDDNDSWTRWYDHYCSLIFNTARRRGLAVSEAQDVLQETIITIARRISQISKLTFNSDEAHFRNLVLRIAHAKTSDYYRKLKRTRRLNARAEEWGEGRPVVDCENDPRLPLAQEALAHVRASTSREMFQMFLLRTLEGNSPQSVAQMLGKTVNAVYVADWKVRDLLKGEAKRLKKSGFFSE